MNGTKHSVYDGRGYGLQKCHKTIWCLVAGMLNVFIRQSPQVGMANYIFPVNAHGLIRTINEDDALLTPLYYVFKQYREKMIGEKIDVTIQGPGMMMDDIKPTIDGDVKEIVSENKPVAFIDAAAVLTAEKNLHAALVNRAAEKEQTVDISLPDGYTAASIWELNHRDINASNTAGNRSEITPKTKTIKSSGKKLTVKLPACGIGILQLVILILPYRIGVFIYMFVS